MRKVVQAGEQVVVPLFNRWNAGVMVHPDFGAEATVEFTFSSKSDIDAETALWDTWAKGAVLTVASDVFDASVSALRLSSQGGASTFEVRG